MPGGRLPEMPTERLKEMALERALERPLYLSPEMLLGMAYMHNYRFLTIPQFADGLVISVCGIFKHTRIFETITKFGVTGPLTTPDRDGLAEEAAGCRGSLSALVLLVVCARLPAQDEELLPLVRCCRDLGLSPLMIAEPNRIIGIFDSSFAVMKASRSGSHMNQIRPARNSNRIPTGFRT
jgi:hypothetical protein